VLVAVEFDAQSLRIGALRWRWDSPSGPPEPECEARETVHLIDVAADAGEALAMLGPLVERERHRFRRSFFRCRNCRQRLPPAARSDSAPREESLCYACALGLGYEQVIY
jgi:hypothetical protein